MVTKINLNNFPYFRDPSNLEKLNRHIRLHPDFMLHQIAIATGCTYEDAMGILMLLYHQELTDVFLVIYHTSQSDTPILTNRFVDGLPLTPFVNPATDEVIESLNELTYEFLFRLKESDLIFIFKRHQ